MTYLFRAAAAAVVFACVIGGAAHAATYNGVTRGELAGVFQRAGYGVYDTGQSDTLRVSNSLVWIANCNGAGRCSQIRFSQTFNDVRPSLSAVNAWNYSKRIPEASIDGNGYLHMEMWMSSIGATDTSITDTLGWFETYVADVSFWSSYIVGY